MIVLMFLSTSCGLAGSVVSEPLDLPAPVEPRLDAQPWSVPAAYIKLVVDAAYENDIPVWLLARLFAWESGWNAGYIGVMNDNGTYDYGIAALNSGCLVYFEQYNDGNKINPFDPATSIRVGANLLAALRGETGSWREAVRRYAGRRLEKHTDIIFGVDKGALQ